MVKLSKMKKKIPPKLPASHHLYHEVFCLPHCRNKRKIGLITIFIRISVHIQSKPLKAIFLVENCITV